MSISLAFFSMEHIFGMAPGVHLHIQIAVSSQIVSPWGFSALLGMEIIWLSRYLPKIQVQ